jgi:hypothetical protein
LTEAVEVAADVTALRPEQRWQELWFAALKHTWSSLVLIPAHAGGSALEIAKNLALVAELHRGSSIKLINAEGADLTGIAGTILQMTSHVSEGGLVIVAVSSIFDNQASIPLALAADAVLLSVTYRRTDTAAAQKTVNAIGKDRFIGAVIDEP